LTSGGDGSPQGKGRDFMNAPGRVRALG